MKYYMPADSNVTCSAVSYAIYHLSQSVDMAGNATEYAMGWKQDNNGAWWMEWDTEMVIPVHSKRANDLAQVLAGFVSSEHLSQQSADNIIALAASREGSTVTLLEVTPPEWVALMVSEENML
jgi:hypothetical protein